jgi:Zn-dependent protease
VSTSTLRTIIWLALLIPSITAHEFMHAYAAYRLGDPTAKNHGRLTLNPLKHLDPFGSAVLPLMMALMGGPIFGYAKPVPVNPRNFSDIRKGDLITGVAGPFANLVLALVGAGLARVGVALGMGSGIGGWLWVIGFLFAQTNLVLMFFNLIPIPPLDGSSIVPVFLPDRWMPGWYNLQRYSFGILMVLMVVVPYVLHVSPLGTYFNYTVEPVLRLLVPGM